MFELIEEKLKENFPESIREIIRFRDEITFLIDKNKIKNILDFLKTDNRFSFDFMIDVCGVDRATQQGRFEVVYNLYSLKNKNRVRIKARVEENDCSIDSVAGIYPAANWAERETFDMFGIIFTGHPDLRRMYMPDDYEYYPLRKDFPLMGIPGSIPLPKR